MSRTRPHPAPPGGASRLPLSLRPRLVAGKLTLVTVLALAVTEVSFLSRLDSSLGAAARGQRTDSFTAAVWAITDLAGTDAIVLVTAVLAAVLAALQHWRGAVALVLSVLTTQAVVTVLKVLVSRPRPRGAMGDPSGFSFPSAHSASAVALYATIALIAATIWNRVPRIAAFVATGAMVVLVGLSRVYLGVHYPTDVLAGWLTGGILVAASWAICSRLPAPRTTV